MIIKNKMKNYLKSMINVSVNINLKNFHNDLKVLSESLPVTQNVNFFTLFFIKIIF